MFSSSLISFFNIATILHNGLDSGPKGKTIISDFMCVAPRCSPSITRYMYDLGSHVR